MTKNPDGTGDNGGNREPMERNGVRRRDLVATANSIESDFRSLVLTLDRTIQMVGSSDQELLERLTNTKVAAERGLRLSMLLSRLTRRKGD